MLDCLKDIKAWMALIFLNFNESKTEVLIFGPSGACDAPHVDLWSLEPYVKPTVKNLGVIMDRDFKLDKQINSVIKYSFFQLRLLPKVKSVVSFSDFERVIHLLTIVIPFMLVLARPPSHTCSWSRMLQLVF